MPSLKSPENRTPPEHNTTYPGNDRFLLEYGQFTIHHSTKQVEWEIDRVALAHFNVTNIVLTPSCDDCLLFEIEYIDESLSIIGIKVTLKNKTALDAFDVRAILMPVKEDDIGGLQVLNADAYTEIWDDGGEVTKNPFKAFGTHNPLREFSSNSQETVLLQVKFDDFSDLLNVPFAIDASWPDNCSEPFALSVTQEGTLYDDGTGSILISALLRTWNQDDPAVSLELVEMDGYPPIPFNSNSTPCGDYCTAFELELNGLPSLDPGMYLAWVKGETGSGSWPIWQKIKIPVYQNPTVINADITGRFSINTRSSNVYDASSHSNHVFVGTQHGVIIYNAENPEELTLEQSVLQRDILPDEETFISHFVRINGGLTCLVDINKGILVYENLITEFTDPIHTFFPETSMILEADWYNNFLHLVSTDSFYKIDFEIPSAPTVHGPFEKVLPDDYDTDPPAGLPLTVLDDNHYLEVNRFIKDSGVNLYQLISWKINEGDNAPSLVNTTPIASTWFGEPGNMYAVGDYILVFWEPDESVAWGTGFLIFELSEAGIPEFMYYKELHINSSGKIPMRYLYEDLYLFDNDIVLDLGHLPDIQVVGDLSSGIPGKVLLASDPARKLGYAWDYEGGGPYAVDISDPVDPIVLGSGPWCEPLSAVYNIEVVDSTAFCAWMDTGLVIIDITDPRHPACASILKTLDQALDVASLDGYVYIADRDGGVVVVNCHDIHNPIIESVLDIDGEATTIDILNGYLLAGRNWTDIRIFDLEIPGNPTVNAFYEDVDEPIRYFTADQPWFIYRTDNFLRVANISVTGSINSPDSVFSGFTANRNGVSSFNGIVCHEHDEMLILRDLENPISDPPESELSLPTGAVRIWLDYLYFYTYPDIYGSCTLYIYDIKNPKNPQETDVMTDLEGDFYLGAPVVFGNYLLLPTGERGIDFVSLL